MARPTVTHDGFLIPNAGVVQNPRMSEPDQVDFSTMTQPLWGVVQDCLVTVTGSTAQTLGGIAIINGAMVSISVSDAVIGTGGDNDRFDLIVADVQGKIRVIHGSPSTNPVYPDPDVNGTVLAAVFCPTGQVDMTEYVIDKRKFVSKSLLTKIDPTAPLIQNLNNTGNHYLVGGDGVTTWEGDTILSRSGPGQLRVHSRLLVDADIDAVTDVGAATLTATGRVTGSNIVSGTVLPTTPTNGMIFQSEVDGKVYIRQGTLWKQLLTAENALPTGTVIQSMEQPSVMQPLGWKRLDGVSTASENIPGEAALFAVLLAAGLSVGSSVAPNRIITLPDSNNKYMMGSNTGIGQTGGSTTLLLTEANVPPHKHNVKVLAGGAASPRASAAANGAHAHVVSGGQHGHDLSDPGHAHHGADFFGNAAPWICLMWGGNNKIDALFNDRNHTYSVEAMDWTSPNVTNITIVQNSRSEHTHQISAEGSHSHDIAIEGISDHIHATTEDSIGSGTPITINPLHLNVYAYIRT